VIESGLKSFRLPQELLQRLEVRAKEDNISSSKIIVQAVTQFLDGPNGPKGYSVIDPELIELGNTLCKNLLEDMKKVLAEVLDSPQPVKNIDRPTIYRPEEILVEPTPGTLGSVEAYTVVSQEVPITEAKEKVSKGTCKDCGGVNYSHFKSCTKRKK
jgi:hypothetical protein